jgi:translation initiation factor 5B
VKIAAPGLENAIAGSPIRTTKNEKDVGRLSGEMEEETEEIKIATEKTGVMVKADALGSLEAVVSIMEDLKIPVKGAVVGDLTKSDVMEMRTVEEPVIFVFGSRVPQDVFQFAKDNSVAIFHSDIIYKIVEDYQKWVADREKRVIEKLMSESARPGRVRVLPGFVFRQKDPAIFGVEVLAGTIKPHYRLCKGRKILGEINEIQDQGVQKEEAVKGDRFAVSMKDVVIGKHAKEGDELEVFLTDREKEILGRLRNRLRPDEMELLDEKG